MIARKFYAVKFGCEKSQVTCVPNWVTGSIRLTHQGPVMHICISKLTIIGSDNCLSPDQRQAIIWTNAGLLLIGPSGTNFSEILIEILTFSFKKMHLKVSSAKRRPFCLGLNVLRPSLLGYITNHFRHQCSSGLTWLLIDQLITRHT